MKPDRWRQIEEIVHAAIEQPASRRLAFLDHSCSGDPELRREVESFLAVSETPENPIQAAIHEAVDSFTGTDHDFRIGERIGPYNITGMIGQGGMGTVYRAVRGDEQYEKQVAIKVVKRGMDTDYVLQRFRQERQILANLEHPNIARLLEGGTTPDGLPYFVMEYIDGQNLLEYSQKNHLSIRERLLLFHDVCLAVQHAHQRLIIHRDIKPGNILVGTDGVAKLLDFGIAKILNPDASENLPTATMTVMRLMTPDYASPEQVRGLPISTATDMYSLGAVLYELLTEQKPHQIKSYTPTEIERAICLAETEKPSVAAARSTSVPSRFPRMLSGDLDNIVLMAMRKEAQRRYQSAGQLAEDIDRYLHDRPIIARPDTLIYRTRKFASRNKLALLSAAIIALSLVGGILAALYQARRAERRFQEVRTLANKFLFDFHDKIKDLPGSTEAREMVVNTALEYLDRLASDAQGDPGLQWELAEAYQKVADVQGDPRGGNVGHSQEAIQSYNKALSLMETLADSDPDELRILRSLAMCKYKVGDMQVEMGDVKGGIVTIREAVSFAEKIHAKNTGNRDDLLMLIRIQRVLGDATLKSRRPRETLKIEQRALQLSDQLLKNFPDDSSMHHWILTLIRVGEAQIETGDLIAGIEAYKKALAVRTDLVRKNPQDTTMLRELRLVNVWLGNHYGGLDTFNLGDSKTAFEYYQKALNIAEELVSHDPKNARFLFDLSICQAKMGEALAESNPAEALKFFEKAISINESLLAVSPSEYRYLSRKALFDRMISLPLRKMGENAAAIAHLQDSLKTWKSMVEQIPDNAEGHSGMHATLLALADILRKSGDAGSSLQYYQQALSIAEKQTQASDEDLYARWRLADSYYGLGNYYASAADWKEARKWFEKNFRIWESWDKIAVSTPFNETRKEQALTALSH